VLFRSRKKRHALNRANIALRNPKKLSLRQLEAVTAILDERNAGEFPPPMANPDEWEKSSQVSEWVLIEIKGFSGFWFGRYSGALDQWVVDNVRVLPPDVIKWWPLP